MASPKRSRKPPERGARAAKRLNLALQGGGSHGAFAWGILDRFLEDGRLDIEGISGTSAGSVNAVVLAYGRHVGGAEGAREALEAFWRALAASGPQLPMHPLALHAFKAFSGAFSPYQWNPLNLNPLRELLERHVDFAELHSCRSTKLFLSATNVRTGKVRVFSNEEIGADTVVASACLPQVFQAVEIDGEAYWDGGYMGNPVLFPLFYETEARDVVIVHINPIFRPGIPRTPQEIEDRVNEITFNSSLIKELRAVAFVQKLLGDGWLKEEFRGALKNVLVHSIRADEVLADLPLASKFSTDWGFLTDLRDRGREAAGEWLGRHFDDLGVRSSVDLRKEFL